MADKMLVWDTVGTRKFHTGISKVALYVAPGTGESAESNSDYKKGVAWQGVTALNENPEGAEATAVYADDMKYLNTYSAEDFKCTLECLDYPDEFNPCLGILEFGDDGAFITQQERRGFGLVYLHKIGSDTKGNDDDQVIHLVYGGYAAPTERNHSTINESTEQDSMSFEISTTPVTVTANSNAYKPTAHLFFKKSALGDTKWNNLIAACYGTNGESATDPYLPKPDKVYEIVTAV